MFETVQAIIAEQLKLEKEKITMESRLTEDLGADSLDAVELTMSLEQEFGIKIPDEEINNMVTIKDVIEIVNKLVK